MRSSRCTRRGIRGDNESRRLRRTGLRCRKHAVASFAAVAVLESQRCFQPSARATACGKFMHATRTDSRSYSPAPAAFYNQILSLERGTRPARTTWPAVHSDSDEIAQRVNGQRLTQGAAGSEPRRWQARWKQRGPQKRSRRGLAAAHSSRSLTECDHPLRPDLLPSAQQSWPPPPTRASFRCV